MKYFDWSKEKNKTLKKERDISFEDVLIAIEEGGIIDVIKNPNKKRYKNQKIFLVKINEYVFLVPFIEDEKKIFFKTIIPSRKATKKYVIKGGK